MPSQRNLLLLLLLLLIVVVVRLLVVEVISYIIRNVFFVNRWPDMADTAVERSLKVNISE